MQRIEGWRITGLVFLALASLTAGVFASQGFTEEAVRMLVRSTARSSLVLFLLAFSASSLHALFRSGWSAWLLRNRRYLGVSFAVSHAGHLAVLVALGTWFPQPFLGQLGWITRIGGGLAYIFIAAMTVTSFDGPRRWLGKRRWDLLHTSGSYYLWILFAQSYLPRASQSVLSALFVFALFGALALRIARRLRKRRAG